MKEFIKSKKGLAALLATLVLAISAVGAYAFFTADRFGHRFGHGRLDERNNITLAGTITGNLYPAGAPAGVSVHGHEPGPRCTVVGTSPAVVTADAGHSAVTSAVRVDAAFYEADSWRHGPRPRVRHDDADAPDERHGLEPERLPGRHADDATGRATKQDPRWRGGSPPLHFLQLPHRPPTPRETRERI